MLYKSFLTGTLFVLLGMPLISHYGWWLIGLGSAMCIFAAGWSLAIGKAIGNGENGAYYELRSGTINVGDGYSIVQLNKTARCDIHEHSEHRDRGFEDWRTHFVYGEVPNTRFVRLRRNKELSVSFLEPVDHTKIQRDAVTQEEAGIALNA